jgi:hypothetical protein
MLRRPKHPTIEVVAPKEEEEVKGLIGQNDSLLPAPATIVLCNCLIGVKRICYLVVVGGRITSKYRVNK